MKILFQIFVLSIGLCACTTKHFVLQKNDGTALIETNFDTGLNRKIESSQIITDIDTSNFRIKFTIGHIDSIEQYMPFHNPGYLKFQNYGDSISITSGNDKPYETKTGSCCHLSILITTEEPMEAFKPNGEKIKRKKSENYNGIWLRQTIRHQIKGKKNIDVILKKKY